MFEFEKVVEQRIADAINRGELNNLPGQGRPLELDDDSFVPEELRLAHRILKNAGFVPEEVCLRRQIFDLEKILGENRDDANRLCSLKRLDFLRATLAARRGYESDFQMQETYRGKLVASLSKIRKVERERKISPGRKAGRS